MHPDSSPQSGVATPKGALQFTAFPNVLLDQVMPTLTDTEWRLLCVVVRQTLGWQDGAAPHRRKAQDWLTHRQLQSRTGRASEALSRALDSLVTKELIAVCDDYGNPLRTASARRGSAGRLFYRLGPASQDHQEVIPLKSEMHVSESEIRKAKTTKETHTKYSPYGGDSMAPRPLMPKAQGTVKPDSEVHRFLRAYRDGFRKHTPHGEPPVIDWGKDGKIVKQLLHVYPYDRLVSLLERFIATDDEWVRRHGYSLYAFKSSIGRLLVQEGRKHRKLREALNNPVTIHTPGWNRAEELARRRDGAQGKT